MTTTNDFGQPVGESLGDWVAPQAATPRTLQGHHCTLTQMQRFEHAIPLFHAFKGAPDSLWTYMPWGPFADASEVGKTADWLTEADGWAPYCVVVDGEAVGMCSYLRMKPAEGVIEIGGIAWSPALAKTAAATEAIYLMLNSAFSAGYRRVEWKCDDLNAPSRSAAARFGFKYEGTFAKATHYKGRSRDTAWFAIIDTEWPKLRMRFEVWLDPNNFDSNGNQIRRLEDILIGR